MPRAVKKSEGIAGIACGGNLCENSVTLSLFARNIFSCKLSPECFRPLVSNGLSCRGIVMACHDQPQ